MLPVSILCVQNLFRVNRKSAPWLNNQPITGHILNVAKLSGDEQTDLGPWYSHSANSLALNHATFDVSFQKAILSVVSGKFNQIKEVTSGLAVFHLGPLSRFNWK